MIKPTDIIWWIGCRLRMHSDKVLAIAFGTAALVRFAHRSPSVSAHTGNGQLSQIEADLERRFAERRALRPGRQAAARKGWQTRRAR